MLHVGRAGWEMRKLLQYLVLALYSGNLSREKTFTDHKEVTILWRKLSWMALNCEIHECFLPRKFSAIWNAKTYHKWIRHVQILWRKLSWMALNREIHEYFLPWKFSAIWYVCVPVSMSSLSAGSCFTTSKFSAVFKELKKWGGGVDIIGYVVFLVTK